MTHTPNLGIALVMQHQAQKEVTVNEALLLIDALLNHGAENVNLNSPPSSPNNGDIYLLGEAPSGDWEGHPYAIAWFYDIWRFITPNEGVTFWVTSQQSYYRYTGAGWNNSLDRLAHLGINSNANDYHRLAVNSAGILFNHNGNSMQITCNKNSASDTTSLLFQDGFSSRVEFGLIGNNHLQLKTSSDGSDFIESFQINHTTGQVDFKQSISLKHYREKVVTATITENYSIDSITASLFELTLTGNSIIDIINAPPNGFAGSLTVIIKQDALGGHIIDWPATILWPEATSPTLSSAPSSIDILTFFTTNNGASWYGFASGVGMG